MEKNLAEEFRKIIDNMSDEELNQKLKELKLLHNVGLKADDYLAFLEKNQKNEHITTKCGYCLTVFEYNNSELEEEEDRDMKGYHYYYYTKCPRCGNRILVKALI